MQILVVLLNLLGMLAAALISRALMLMLLRRFTRGERRRLHPLATPMGSSLAFGVIFVAVWCLLNAVAVLVWFIVWPR
jgi:hypothetical protein